MLLSGLIDKDLAGCRLRYGYSLEIKCHGMGYFPAIAAQSKKIVVCFDREHLKMIWEKLPRRPVKISKDLFLVDSDLDDAALISIGAITGDDIDKDSFFFIIDADHLEGVLAQEEFFKWDDSGLAIRITESDAVFPEE